MQLAGQVPTLASRKDGVGEDSSSSAEEKVEFGSEETLDIERPRPEYNQQLDVLFPNSFQDPNPKGKGQGSWLVSCRGRLSTQCTRALWSWTGALRKPS